MAVVKFKINDQNFSFPLTVKEFSTGSIGYNLADKIALEIDGKIVRFQITLNVILIGSKELDDPKLKQYWKEKLEEL